MDLLVDQHLDCFHFWLERICYKHLLTSFYIKTHVFISLGYIPNSGWVDMVTMFSLFAKPFSQTAVLFYIPTAVNEGSNFFTSSAALLLFFLL